MPSKSPTIYLIAGCNGAGKTTFANVFLRKEVKVLRFINADEIARGLSPLAPEALAFRAGKLLLEEVRGCIERKEIFALEGMLSGRTYIALLRHAQHAGYRVELHYLWLASEDIALQRVGKRVLFQKGHDVPERDIRRRFTRSLENVLSDYLDLSDRWVFWKQYQSARKIARVVRDTLCLRIEGGFMKTNFRKSKTRSPLPEFVQQGLRAHREATRNVRAEERRLGIKRDSAIITAIRKS